MRTFFIFLFVALVSLIVYNPEMEDFKAYTETLHAEKAKAAPERTSTLTRMMKQDTVLAGTPELSYATERNNFLIFSTYSITRNTSDNQIEQKRYFGIAGMFFEMSSSDEPMAAHAAQP